MIFKINSNLIIIVMFLLHIALFFSSCKKESEVIPPPTIQFMSDNGFVYNDTTLLLGDFVRIGIIGESNGKDNITQLHYEILADSQKTVIDSGLNAEKLVREFTIQKGISYQEKWTFSVRDRYGRESNSLSVIFTKDSASIFGNIIHIPSLVLGAQNNSTIGSFYSFESALVYYQDQAFLNQNLINILYFYDNAGDENTISSSNANIDASIFPAHSSGDTLGMINWAIRNETRFQKLEFISISDFDDCNHDSLLLTNTFVFPTGKRKAKNLQPGDLYSFILNDQTTKGIFKVLNVEGVDQGKIEIEVKIQDFND